MDRKLQVNDLINIGIFAAVYIVLMMAVVTVAGMVPILYIIAPLLVAILCASVYMVFVMRTPKTGAVFIMSVLIAFVFMGSGYYASIWVLCIGIITEVYLRNDGYKSLKKVKYSYLMYSLTTIGPYFGIIIMKDIFLERTADYYGTGYADRLEQLLPSWVLLVLIAATIIAAFIGVSTGEKILKKHFRKAGIV